MNKIIFILFLLVYSSVSGQNISVDSNYSATQLVQDVLVNSGCIQVSNVSVSGGNFGSSETSYGYFNANGSILPFTDGVLLTTGKLTSAVGPNSNFSDDGSGLGWNGDTDLNTALGLSNSYNATVLEFDFVPNTSQISFDYIFASEQYLSNPGSNQCNFTDGFAFLLKEASSSSYQNLAVIPGTNTPVKVNTVRGSGTICPPANEAYFDAFNSGNYPTTFDGQTKTLTAQANVTPGTLYHIKLVIADEGNARFDSGIFLKAGSFNSRKDLGPDRLLATGNPLCSGENFVVNAFENLATAYQWFENGTPITGATSATYTINHAGEYSVEIEINSNCTIFGSIKIEQAPALLINDDSYSLCDTDTDGKANFDLNAIKTSLFTNLPTGFQIEFFETSTSTTALPSNYSNTTPFTQTIYAKITNIQNCYVPFPVYLTVNVFNPQFPNENISICNSNNELLVAPAGFSSYSWNTTPVQNTPTITVNSSGTYIVTITNSNGCTTTKTFVVSSSEAPTITSIEVNDFEEELSATINVQGNGNYQYALNGGAFQANPTFILNESGEYEIVVNDSNGCGTATASFYALSYPKYFTPNGDGYHDTWKIENLDKKGLENSRIYIFDRFGKLLKQILASGEGWNGYFNNQMMPSSDYWFVLELTNGKTIKGHFSLKR